MAELKQPKKGPTLLDNLFAKVQEGKSLADQRLAEAGAPPTVREGLQNVIDALVPQSRLDVGLAMAWPLAKGAKVGSAAARAAAKQFQQKLKGAGLVDVQAAFRTLQNMGVSIDKVTDMPLEKARLLEQLFTKPVLDNLNILHTAELGKSKLTAPEIAKAAAALQRQFDDKVSAIVKQAELSAGTGPVDLRHLKELGMVVTEDGAHRLNIKLPAKIPQALREAAEPLFVKARDDKRFYANRQRKYRQSREPGGSRALTPLADIEDGL